LRILVLGLGNDLYGDDGVGLHAVRLLKEEWAGRNGVGETAGQVDFVECTLSGLALLDVILGYDALVIIDTIVNSEPVTGRVRLLEGTELRDFPGPSPHYVSIPQTLTIGRQLGLPVPRWVKIVAVEAKDLYRLGEGLSEDMTRRLPEVIEATKGVLRALGTPLD
jgi:hydrogenase maturation protease